MHNQRDFTMLNYKIQAATRDKKKAVLCAQEVSEVRRRWDSCFLL
jgi:hypothetical protein